MTPKEEIKFIEMRIVEREAEGREPDTWYVRRLKKLKEERDSLLPPKGLKWEGVEE